MTSFRDALGSAPRVGLWMNLTDPAAQEIALSSGFDWVLLDGEHSPVTLDQTLRALQIARGYDVDLVVRAADGDDVRLKRLLDIGVRTLLVPMVETAEQAAALAAAIDFPPAGVRGVSSQTRGGDWGRRPGYLTTARAELCLIVQIESARGVANAAAMLATPGVDAAFVGTADLAASMGHPGRPDHPEVAAAVARVVDEAQQVGVPLGTLTRDLDAARGYVAQGFTFVAVGTDSSILAGSLADLRRRAAF